MFGASRLIGHSLIHSLHVPLLYYTPCRVIDELLTTDEYVNAYAQIERHWINGT